MAGLAQEPPSFEEVTVFLSRAEWDALPPPQRRLYRDVVADTYELLTSLGYPGPKPDILHRLERGEEPWICPAPGERRRLPRPPGRGESGFASLAAVPPAGRAQSCLEEPSWGRWPGASGCRGLPTSCPAGRSAARRGRDGSSRENFGRHAGRSQFPWEAGTGVASQTQPWLVKEEAQEKPRPVRDPTRADETFPRLWNDPGERNPGQTPSYGQSPGEPRVEELRAAVGKDHSYCQRSEPQRRCGPRSLLEHDYSERRRAGKNGGAGAAPERRRARRGGGTVQRAREILRRYRFYRRMAPPRRGSCGGAAHGTDGGVRPPTAAAAARQLGGARGVTSNPSFAPEGILGSGDSTPDRIPAEGARKGARNMADLGGKRRPERCECPGTGLQGIVRDVLKAVRCILDSMCRTFELRGSSQGKSIWPIVIQIDNLAEIREP